MGRMALKLILLVALAACSSAPRPIPTDSGITHGPESTSQDASPTPTPSPTAEATLPLADLVGRLGGSAELSPAGYCHYLTDASGQRWEVQVWPTGYHVEFRDDLATLIGPDGSVIAKTGDTVAVNGAPSPNGSFCMVGIPYDATELVGVRSARP